MREFTYRKIDAFTSEGSAGNPAACIHLSRDGSLSDAEMLLIARQHQGFVSETVFCQRTPSDISLIYYSSRCEVDFCGHGTIACLYDLIREDPPLMDRPELTVTTRRKGPLTVYNRIRRQDAVFITAPEPRHPGTSLSREIIASSLELPVSALDAALPIDCINAGLDTLIVPIAALADEVNAHPHEERLRNFCLEHGIDIVLIYSRETADARYFAHSRVFAPKFGYLEDPATGSGNSALGYYLLASGLWKGQDISVEQGGAGIAFNNVMLTVREGRVLFGGSATRRIAGTYYL